MCLIIALLGVDGNLGRINHSMLTDQQMMELFITPDDHEEHLERLGGDEYDACTWSGIECKAEKQVTTIDWHSARIKIEGLIDFQALPPHLETLNLYEQNIHGEIETTALPPEMKCLCIQRTPLKGTLDMGSLPPNISEVTVTDNKVQAVINFVNLPQALRHCSITEKFLEPKSLHIGRLPANDLKFGLRKCGFNSVTFENAEDEKRVTL